MKTHELVHSDQTGFILIPLQSEDAVKDSKEKYGATDQQILSVLDMHFINGERKIQAPHPADSYNYQTENTSSNLILTESVTTPPTEP